MVAARRIYQTSWISALPREPAAASAAAAAAAALLILCSSPESETRGGLKIAQRV